MEAVEYCESSTTTLEWTVKGLKNLFDSSKGDLKSKVSKSVKFGGGRWQVLFYPNSGHEGGFVSLYLSCEPTEEEKERAVDGKWVREGLFKFSFELRNVNRGHLSQQKEACDHAFSYKTANWGWAQFAKRDTVFYNSNIVRHVDAFLIICNITSSPIVPSPIPPIPVKSVPRSLMDAVGGMLNDPVYSDVQFILPARRRDGRQRPPRTIYAAKRILQRVEYFDLMFSSGFAEAVTSPAPSTVNFNALSDNISISVVDENEDGNHTEYAGSTFDDSDQSEPDPEPHDGGNVDTPMAEPYKTFASPTSTYRPQRNSMMSYMSGTTGTAVNSTIPYDPANDTGDSLRQDTADSIDIAPSDSEAESGVVEEVGDHEQNIGGEIRLGTVGGVEDGSTIERGSERETIEAVPLSSSSEALDGRVDGPLASSPRRPRSRSPNYDDGKITLPPSGRTSSGSRTPPGVKPTSPARRMATPTKVDAEEPVPGPRKTKVVVKECEYATYYAVLYYLYTDTIVFCPLTSDFLTRAAPSMQPSSSPGGHASSSNPLFRGSPNSLSLMSNGMASSSSSSLYPSSPFSSAFAMNQAASNSYQQPYNQHARRSSSSSLPMQGHQHQQYQNQQQHPYGTELGEAVHRSRREWVRAWMAANPGRPAPCSAKACYRLADKLGLTELRARAFQHIVKSLTVSNVPYEVFSSFSATFEEVRKVQVEFFLANWAEIKMSEAMRNVFQQIRLGRHPGFEEVWPLIIMNLDYNPRPANETNGDGVKEVVLL